MFQPSRYDNVYPFSYMYTYLVSVPHSILIQLADPTANKAYGMTLSLLLLCGDSCICTSAEYELMSNVRLSTVITLSDITYFHMILCMLCERMARSMYFHGAVAGIDCT